MGRKTRLQPQETRMAAQPVVVRRVQPKTLRKALKLADRKSAQLMVYGKPVITERRKK